MSFDYRELMTQVFADQEEKRPCPGVSCGEHTQEEELGCQLCSTTAPPDCKACLTTGAVDSPDCQPCSTTKKRADGSWSRDAQDLTLLRQQLRDSLSAG